jgi:two-component system NtrC family sensor kinase
VKELDDNVPPVRGDLNAMKQCFTNIIQNAVDSIEIRSGGMIKVKAYALNEFVRIDFEDNGVGIDEALVDKIFEPFFSTKDTGKGVGLGLTLCYEFLNKMGGNIEVESTLGRGSTFKVTLPASTKQGKVGT